MSCARGAQRGLTLIELIIYIVVVLVGLAGVLTVFNTTVRGSADPVVRKQALALAEAMLEEVLAKDYQNDPTDPGNLSDTVGCTPNTPASLPRCRVNTPVDRANYNDVDDYNGWNQAGNSQAVGTAPAALAGYAVTVAVGAPAAVNGVMLKAVTVTVTNGAETVTLQGWRGNF